MSAVREDAAPSSIEDALGRAHALLVHHGYVVRKPQATPPADLVVHLPGPPRGWGRTGHTIIRPKDPRKPAFVSVYTDSETRSYQAMLRYAAEQAMAGRALYGGALRVRINALFEVPASTSKKARAEMLSGIIRPTKKPDFDNLAKMVDAFKGVIWTDDVQIVDGRVVKAYAEKPCWEMEVYALRLRPALL